jgi:hypothetical protein
MNCAGQSSVRGDGQCRWSREQLRMAVAVGRDLAVGRVGEVLVIIERTGDVPGDIHGRGWLAVADDVVLLEEWRRLGDGRCIRGQRCHVAARGGEARDREHASRARP